MKFILILTIVASSLWQLSFSSESWWEFIALTCLSCSWPVATIYGYDFIMTMRGKNSKYMQEFYNELKRDLLFSFIGAIVFFGIAFTAPIKYSLTNIDIAFAGFPFLLYSMSDIMQLRKLKIAGVKFSRKIVWTLATILTIVGIIYVHFAFKIYSGTFSDSKSLWVQISLLLTALCSLVGAHQMTFIIKKQRMEVSPVLIALFSNMRTSPGIYKESQKAAKKWNEVVIQKKAELRQSQQRKKKKNR